MYLRGLVVGIVFIGRYRSGMSALGRFILKIRDACGHSHAPLDPNGTFHRCAFRSCKALPVAVRSSRTSRNTQPRQRGIHPARPSLPLLPLVLVRIS